MTKLQLKGSWNELKGKLKEQYANLTDCFSEQPQTRSGRATLGAIAGSESLKLFI